MIEVTPEILQDLMHAGGKLTLDDVECVLRMGETDFNLKIGGLHLEIVGQATGEGAVKAMLDSSHKKNLD
jgi:hypothetical protein